MPYNPKKNKHKKSTLELEHIEKTMTFQKERQKMKRIQKELEINKTIFNKLEYNNDNSLKNNDNDKNKRKSIIKDKIKYSQNNSYGVKNEIEYFLDTIDIFKNYYKIENNDDTNIQNEENEHINNDDTNIQNEENEHINNDAKISLENTNVNPEILNDNSEINIFTYFKKNIETNSENSDTKYNKIKTNAELYKEYIKMFDNIDDYDKINNIYCTDCNLKCIYDQKNGSLICLNCGLINEVLVDNDKINNKDNIFDNNIYAYKKK